MTGSRVLIVDDDPMVRELVVQVLEGAGYAVTSAVDAPTALAALDEALPALVLSDVNMPGMSGFDLLERLRALPGGRSLPFVFLTTRAGIDDVVRGLGLGADDYLVKPFSVPELLARVQVKIERPSVPAALLDELAAQAVHEQTLAQEVRRAAMVQRGLLPRRPPDIEGWDVAGACIPTQGVAGDFYDWYEQSGTLVLTLADVMGKGIGGAILMATVRAVLRGTDAQVSLAEAVGQASTMLSTDLDQTTSFVTLFHGNLDCTTGELRYVDAGHGLAAVARADGTVDRLEHRGLPLGMFDDSTWTEGTTVLEPGDAFVTFSDGLLEAAGDPTSDADVVRVLETVATVVRNSPNAKSAVVSLTASVERAADDVTVIVVRRRA